MTNRSWQVVTPNTVARGGTAPEVAPGEPRALVPSELRYLVVATQREGNRVFARAVGDLGLTPSHAEILAVLDEFGPMSLRDLGEMIVCEASAPSRIVDTLVRRGLVERTSDPADRRAIIISLTDAARAKLPALREIERQVDHATADQLTPDQQAMVAAVLRGFLTGTEAGDALERRFARKARSARHPLPAEPAVR
ncbi:HTH-type transcriptional repressor NicR [mine drainage metagenome]|uniref:HTH-type transcriptional repressor NicR n=1 Tax=mine drainage metagenome TaxID=410659 RepID=A0A1J5RL98_9ZZZZ